MEHSSSEQGIVRIVKLTGDGGEKGLTLDHVGMGMLLDERTIVTCAHVVNAALGLYMYKAEPPEDGASVMVTFPLLGDQETAIACVLDWSSPGRNGLDCAILKLESPAPERAGHTILSIIPPEDLEGAELSVYGSLGPEHPGSHNNAHLLGEVGAQWSQLEVAGRFGVQPGFSGGAVWDRNQKTSIGILVARQTGTKGTTAYFLSARRIGECFAADIPIEIRKMRLGSQSTFSIIAIILFVLMLIHFMAMQGEGSSVLVPWSMNSKELAAYFGTHCFAVILGPYVMWHAAQHARSFAMRNWWQRVPVAFGGKTAAMLTHSRFSALMVILFLIALPIYAQGAFLDKVFFQERPVFVNIARFDETKHCVGEKEKQTLSSCKDIGVCQKGDPNWCRHKDVNVVSFLKSFPYFDHAYQIAGTCQTPDNCKMVTFFPLFQPLILFLATLFAYAYFILFVWALIRPWPYPLSSKMEINK